MAVGNQSRGRHFLLAGWLAGLVAVLLVAGSVLVLSNPAGAIERGEEAADVASIRASVWIGNCTGVLVAPDLVLSALHCLDAADARPEYAEKFGESMATRFGFIDWERPDRFYPLAKVVTVSVGVDKQNPRATVEASEYSVPGSTDMVLLRLDSTIASADATPVEVMTTVPDSARSNPTRWIESKNLTVRGFGKTGLGEGHQTAMLRSGEIVVARYPCPYLSEGWGFGEPNKFCAKELAGIGRPGDSGGGAFWVDGDGDEWLVGIFQGLEGKTGSRFVATFFRGGVGYADRVGFEEFPLPTIGGWIDGHLANSVAGEVARIQSVDPLAQRRTVAVSIGRLQTLVRCANDIVSLEMASNGGERTYELMSGLERLVDRRLNLAVVADIGQRFVEVRLSLSRPTACEIVRRRAPGAWTASRLAVRVRFDLQTGRATVFDPTAGSESGEGLMTLAGRGAWSAAALDVEWISVPRVQTLGGPQIWPME